MAAGAAAWGAGPFFDRGYMSDQELNLKAYLRGERQTLLVGDGYGILQMSLEV